MVLNDREHLLYSFKACLHPALRPVGTVIAITEGMPGFHRAVEKTTIVHHPRKHLDVRLYCSIKCQSAGPGLKGIKDDHCPVNEFSKLLEAVNEIQCETIGRSRCNTQTVGKAGILEC